MSKLFAFFQDIKFNFNNFFAVVIMGFCFGYFMWISANPKAAANPHVGEIKTAMIGLMVLVAQWYFGSSRSASKKDEVIHSMTETAKNLSETKT